MSRNAELLDASPHAQHLLKQRVLFTTNRRRQLTPILPEAEPAFVTLLRAESFSLAHLRGAANAEFIAFSRPQPSSLLLVLTDATAPLDIAPAATLFKLTPAETRLAGALVNTGTLDRAMLKLDISRNTVRAQMSAIFHKTGTARQGELIRQFTKIAVIAHMCDDF